MMMELVLLNPGAMLFVLAQAVFSGLSVFPVVFVGKFWLRNRHKSRVSGMCISALCIVIGFNLMAAHTFLAGVVSCEKTLWAIGCLFFGGGCLLALSLFLGELRELDREIKTRLAVASCEKADGCGC